MQTKSKITPTINGFMKNRTINFIIALVLSCGVTCSCGISGRTNIGDIHNCVILKQHCGFDNLDGGYYQVRDLKTGAVKRIDVDIRDCGIYDVGDTVPPKHK